MPRIVHVALHHTIPLTYLREHAHVIREARDMLRTCNIRFDINETHREQNLINANGCLTETVTMVMNHAESEVSAMNRAVELARYPALLTELLDDRVTVGRSVVQPEMKYAHALVLIDLDELAVSREDEESSGKGVRSATPTTVIIRQGENVLHAALATVDDDLYVDCAPLLG